MKVNKILILFIFIIMVNFMIIWEVLQSKWVANNVSKVITSYVQEVLEGDVKFENLAFTMFPPGAEIRNVNFYGQIEKTKVRMELEKLGVYFNPIDALSTTFTVHNIEIADGFVLIEQKEKSDSSSKEESKTKIDPNSLRFLDKVPVKNAGLVDIKLKYNEEDISIRNLQLSNEPNDLRLRGKVESIDLVKWTTIDKMIDEAEFDITLDPYKLQINTLKVNSDYIGVSASGDITSYLSKNIAYALDVDVKAPINQIHDWVDLKKIGELNKGVLKLKSKITGEAKDFRVESEVELRNFVTDFLYGDKASAKIIATNESIKFLSTELEAGDQEFKLLKPFEFYNLKTKKFVEEPIMADVKNLKMSNFLRYLRESTSMLEGSITGQAEFRLYKNSYTFEIAENSKINNFKVKAGAKTDIIALEDFKMTKSMFRVDDGAFSMNLGVSKGDTNLNVSGEIDSEKFLIDIPVSFVDFSDIGRIANLDFKGKGTFNLKLHNKYKKLQIDSNLRLNDFAFEGYRLDKIQSKLEIDLDDGKLLLPNISGILGETLVNGSIGLNLNELTINGNYKAQKVSLSTAKKILAPIIGNLSLSNKEFHGYWNTEGEVSGELDIEKIKLLSTLESNNTYIYDENLERVSANLNIINGNLVLNDFKASKSRGKLAGNLNYDLDQESMKLVLDISNLPIQESSYYSKVPLNLRGNLNGRLNLLYKNSKWLGHSKIRLDDTFVFNKKYKDSIIRIDIDDEETLFDLSLFGSEIDVESFVSFNKAQDKPSYVNLALNIDNIRDILGIFSGIDLVNNDLDGNVNYQLRFDFNPYTLRINNYNSNMRKLFFRKSPINVDYEDPNPEIIVENGVVKKWDTNIRGKKFYVISTGSGNLRKDYDTTTQIKVDSSILEIFNNFIYKAGGNIRGKLIYGHKSGKDKYEANITSNNLSLTTTFIPTAITKSDMKISFKDGVLTIDKFLAQLVNGNFNLGGSVNLKKLIPDINLRYEFKNAGVTVMDKSNLTFSGSGSLIGKTFPYTLGGDFYIQKFILVNEITDYLKGDKSIGGSSVDYLPESTTDSGGQFLNFNVNVLTREPVYIRNSLADLGFVGNLQVIGGERDPRIIGKVDLAARRNKITFKNNEYLFSKGSVFFVERNKVSNPILDFVTTSTINNHKVSVKLIGPVKNYKLELSSEPSLAQSDILSLIAFGYTEDLSNNLSDSEKESMTRAGVGSIIFDSFKINETLKNEFGLQVNLGTSISKEEGSYLSKRNSEASGVGKVNSATTFEIKKKLTEAMSLSVSSTVGSTTAQKQSMNLNYNLNNNISLEGVYESKSKDDTETINEENSVGADIKWRWTFK